ncbi:MAG: BON domain-containing protein [Candidatus Rokubacteria bacterium]|nr:BON domain-containing protein [Candidatus Rokubacteria bacterium]
MRRALVLFLALGLAGCDIPYKIVTEERPFSVLVDDETITLKIKKRFFDSLPAALALTVFCHQGLVVLAGVVQAPKLGERAVETARAVEGVKRVETYFVPSQPAPFGDLGISARIKAKIIGDMDLRLSQVDMAVIAGHAVLTGVVDRQEKIDRIIRHAQSVEGVVTVKSFLQLKAP